MVTALPRPFVAFWNTFVLDEHARIPTPGMAVLYERLVRAHPGSPVVYLSTGAWNVAPTLTRFLSRNLYPAGPLLLTDWGPTHDRWFRSGRAHKEENLRRLADEFPGMRWLLIGDDGQHDEELYARFAAEHPDRVAAVAIRRLSTGEAVLAGGRTKAEQHGAEVPWVSASDGCADRRSASPTSACSESRPAREPGSCGQAVAATTPARSARARRMRASPRLTCRAHSGPR